MLEKTWSLGRKCRLFYTSCTLVYFWVDDGSRREVLEVMKVGRARQHVGVRVVQRGFKV
jgi:hypothetical protein